MKKILLILIIGLIVTGNACYMNRTTGEIENQSVNVQHEPYEQQEQHDSTVKNNIITEEQDQNIESDDKTKTTKEKDFSAQPVSQTGIARKYFEAVTINDLENFRNCFAKDASIVVVNRTLKNDDIANFATREVFGGVYEIYRVIEENSKISILLQFTPEGWNKPEPMAVYEFFIIDDLIVDANLQYAKKEDFERFSEHTLELSTVIPNSFNNYLEAVIEDDASKLAKSFTEEGIIRDVSRYIRGQNAIVSWANNEVLSLNYQTGRITYRESGVEVINHITFSSGSGGFYASYDLDLDNGLISYANLQYAKESDFNYNSILSKIK